MKFTIEFQRKAASVATAITDNAIMRAILNVLGDASPVYLNADTGEFMKAYQENPIVYSVITPIVKRCATMRLTTVTGKRNGVLDLIDQPNKMTTRSEFVQSVMTNLAACGVAFIWKNKPTGSKVLELWNVPAKDTTLQLGRDLTIASYKFGWRDTAVPATDVIMLRLPNADNTNPGQNLTGLSPLNACRKIITESDEAIKANAKSMINRMPRTMISPKEGNIVTPDQMKELEKEIQKAGSGDKFLATSAPLVASTFGYSPVDLNIQQTMARAKRDIAGVYGVPFEYFEPSTYSNKGDAKQDFINNAVLPLFTVLVDALNSDPDMKAMTGEPLIIDMATIPELRKDLVSLSTALSGMWWLTGNERRAACDYEPLDDPLMDVPMVPPGFIPIDQINDINNLPAG